MFPLDVQTRRLFAQDRIDSLAPPPRVKVPQTAIKRGATVRHSVPAPCMTAAPLRSSRA